MTTDHLQAVRQASQARRQAEAAYRQALQDARDAGCSAAVIAEACGTSRQNVLKLTASLSALDSG